MNDNSEWLRLLVGTLLGALLTFIGSVIFYHYQSREPNITYEIFPRATFKSDSQHLTIQSIRVENSGEKEAEEIVFSITLPRNSVFEDQSFSASSRSLEESIAMDTAGTNPNVIGFDYSFPLLNAGESISYSYLIKSSMDEDIKAELRGVGVMGGPKITSSDNENPVIYNGNYILLFGSVLIIFLIILTIFLISGRSRSQSSEDLFYRRSSG